MTVTGLGRKSYLLFPTLAKAPFVYSKISNCLTTFTSLTWNRWPYFDFSLINGFTDLWGNHLAVTITSLYGQQHHSPLQSWCTAAFPTVLGSVL